MGSVQQSEHATGCQLAFGGRRRVADWFHALAASTFRPYAALFAFRKPLDMLILCVCRRVDPPRRGTEMPLRETEAIILRTYRLGEADKIASLFTRQLGRLRAVAAGAQRPKSRYGGTLEPPELRPPLDLRAGEP